jgi:hypothetical protein
MAKENCCEKETRHLFADSFLEALLSPWAPPPRQSIHASAKIWCFLVTIAYCLPINRGFAFAARICDDTVDSQRQSTTNGILASIKGE